MASVPVGLPPTSLKPISTPVTPGRASSSASAACFTRRRSGGTSIARSPQVVAGPFAGRVGKNTEYQSRTPDHWSAWSGSAPLAEEVEEVVATLGGEVAQAEVASAVTPNCRGNYTFQELR